MLRTYNPNDIRQLITQFKCRSHKMKDPCLRTRRLLFSSQYFCLQMEDYNVHSINFHTPQWLPLTAVPNLPLDIRTRAQNCPMVAEINVLLITTTRYSIYISPLYTTNNLSNQWREKRLYAETIWSMALQQNVESSQHYVDLAYGGHRRYLLAPLSPSQPVIADGKIRFPDRSLDSFFFCFPHFFPCFRFLLCCV